ncbi:glycosyltransferase family 2 protein [Autumnicola musiva]|uniref:Glycosyltransferase family 2 protein n=1 Tax=Autumnicola musiva TaxID=3075589 RepID=A0ABU3D349_9FLAO|nr:glycosyltransferase family 2 protein [Zunongwangia sp. F117]MDT0675957.1 glycosyltransferase family 2 protein [Zunongwangia sp. F117]
MDKESKEILVSVSIITYNQKEFIGEAIDSVLMQEVDFNYEIIIGDDCSSDGTQEILKEYEAKYPAIIQLILHPRRYSEIPGRTNNITNIYACRGKYIALLDGDDFWISKDKLQKQVDFLEANPDYSIFGHQAKIAEKDSKITAISKTHHEEKFDSARLKMVDLFKTPYAFISTSTFMFRNNALGEFPGWFWEIISADFALMLLLTQKGDLKFSKDIYSGYRRHGDSFMVNHFFTVENLALKINELRLYRKVFIPYSFHENFLKYLKKSSAIQRRIAYIKYYHLAKLHHEKQHYFILKKTLPYSLTDLSFLFFPKLVYKKLRKSVLRTK